MPWTVTCIAATRRGRARRSGTTRPRAATTRPATLSGMATEHAPSVISSVVVAKPSCRTRSACAARRPGWTTVYGV